MAMGKTIHKFRVCVKLDSRNLLSLL